MGYTTLLITLIIVVLKGTGLLDINWGIALVPFVLNLIIYIYCINEKILKINK